MSNTTQSLSEQTLFERLTSRRVGRWLILSGILFILLVPMVKGWRLYQLARAFQAHQVTAEALLAAGPTALDPDTAETLVRDIRTDYVALQREVEPLLFLTPHLAWLPEVGPLMPDAETLLIMGDAGTETALHLVTGLKPALAILQDDSLGDQRIPALTQVLADAQPQLNRAAGSFDTLVATRQQLGDISNFPYTAQVALDLFDQYTPIAQEGLRVAPAVPAILGQAGTRQYLIVAQNEEELRPTGGFISGVGLLTIEQGNILSLDFQDAYQVDNLDNLAAYGWPPEPLQFFMGSDYFLFRDSNFWPDFPTSAEQMMTLYELGTGVTPDGVIALDQRFLELFIIALDPVEVPELGITLTKGNVRDALRGAWETGDEDELWLTSRKSFMGPMANSILQKILQEPTSLDPLALADALQTALQSKHLQIYMTDPAVHDTLTAVNWTGELRPQPNQDNLLLLDTNLGFNKINAISEKHVSYEVSLVDLATPQATLITTYHNPSTGSRSCSDISIAYSVQESINYEELLDVCYRNYIRLYTPAGTTLLSSSEHPVKAEYMLNQTAWAGQVQPHTEIPEWQTFTNFIVIPQQETIQTNFTYKLPETVLKQTGTDQTTYALTVYKQAGAKPHPFVMQLQLPDNTQLVHTQPTPTAVDGQTLTFETSINQNLTFTITFSEKPHDS